jgi:hypothetical protein
LTPAHGNSSPIACGTSLSSDADQGIRVSVIGSIGPRNRGQLRLASADAMILAAVEERAIAANANAKALGSPDNSGRRSTHDRRLALLSGSLARGDAAETFDLSFDARRHLSSRATGQADRLRGQGSDGTSGPTRARLRVHDYSYGWPPRQEQRPSAPAPGDQNPRRAATCGGDGGLPSMAGGDGSSEAPRAENRRAWPGQGRGLRVWARHCSGFGQRFR